MQDKAYEVIRDHQGKHWWFRGRARIAQTVLLRDLDLNNGDILDVGAGFGGMVPLLKTLGTVEALEPYEDARKALEETGALVRIEGIESFLAGRKDCYDLITLFDVLEHIEDDRGTVAGIRRALKPGGRLVLTVPAMPVLWSAHDELHNHFRRYTRKGLRSILGDCFEIERLGYYNSLLWPRGGFGKENGYDFVPGRRVPMWNAVRGFSTDFCIGFSSPRFRCCVWGFRFPSECR